MALDNNFEIEAKKEKSSFLFRAGQYYQFAIIQYPKLILVLLFFLIMAFAFFIPRVQLDVSADSLILENDRDLSYYREIRKLYGSDDFLIITYTPNSGLFDKKSIEQLGQLKQELVNMSRVDSVVSILDVPLLQSPPQTLNQVAEKTINLLSADVDSNSAREELLHSPLYSNRLTSLDGSTTALQVNFVENEQLEKLKAIKEILVEKQQHKSLKSDESNKLEDIKLKIDVLSEKLLQLQQIDIANIRNILSNYQQDAELHLGGVPMIVVDMKQFIRHDLVVFGTAVLGILSLFLWIVFRRLRWIVLSLMTASATTVVTLGFIGLSGWKITVVSSNFIALLLIFSLSLSIHLIVRHRELHAENPFQSQRFLVTEMLKSKWYPCLFTVLTTLVAFASLVLSGIRPVIDFGWFMVTALTVALFLSFTLFPVVLMLLRPGYPIRLWKFTATVTNFFANLVERFPHGIWISSLLILIISVYGITKLSVENRFIDYFKSNTEIYQGMLLVDQQLGGTTPLDVIIDAPVEDEVLLSENSDETYNEDGEEEDLIFAEFDDEQEAGFAADSYWYKSYMMQEIKKIHQTVESSPFTGKVLSLDTTFDVLNILNENEPIDDFFLSLVYKKLSTKAQQQMINPFLSEDGNQLRFDVRIYDSDPNLKRQDFLDDLHEKLVNEAGLQPQQIHFTGMTVLYNNMLQTLFQSQILTLGVVFLAILITFIWVFKSISVAAIALVPNILSAGPVLGLMGLLSIPLDIMTITIAAISIGIAVDNTIHYIHRFKEEWKIDFDYHKAMHRAHHSIGRAMYYTSVTITLGFSVLAFSNFVPTIYFGLLTAFAMIAALLADLAVLPWLLQRFKPYGEAT